jgi:signal transduction histidine kinase
MRRPWTTWLARGMWTAAVMFMIAAFVVVVTGRAFDAEDALFIPVGSALILGYGTVGALIVSRHPRNAIGWLLLVVAIVFAINIFGEEYVARSYVEGIPSLPFTILLAWFNSWTFGLGLGAVPMILLLFPTGRPPSSRWTPLVWVIGSSALGIVGLAISTNPLQSPEGIVIQNPIGIDGPLPPILMTAGGVAAVVGGLASAVALVVRFRRSSGEERQQIRWLAYVGATAALLLLMGFANDILLGGGQGGPLDDALFIGFVIVIGVGVPAACGVAILRYRLYELDVVIKKTVVFAILAGFVALAYVAVAGAIGVLVGGTGDALTIFVLAFVLGTAFGPVRRLARRIADRIVYGRRATPYEVLTRFTERVAGSYAADDVLSRMAQILADGTGARSARVWLRVGADLRPAAAWPSNEPSPHAVTLRGESLPALPGDEMAFEVRDGEELLGALSLSMPANDPMDPSKERLARDLASQAGLVLRNVRLIEELRASRQRLVAAQDEERRRLERNIHDGAQQQLVALGVRMRLLDALIGRDPGKARETLAQLQRDTADALDDLRDLARGIYPPLLADAGLVAALDAQARRSPVPVEVDADGIGRYERDIEAAVYFCTLEALQNVAKYANAASAGVRLRERDGFLAFAVTDDGRGFDPTSVPSGTGLQGMADRIDALGGSLRVRSQPGAGTTVEGRVPVTTRAKQVQDDVAAAHADSSRSGPKAALGM